MRLDLSPKQRVDLVRGIFSRIAGRYDLLNHVLSLGRDRFWRRAAARRMRLHKTGRLLDAACGTGDMALALAEARAPAVVVGLDFIEAMLEIARPKIAARRLENRVFLVQGDACRLPFPDEYFDSASIAFGIRNIPDKTAVLSEMSRVLSPGGRLVVLELTFPRWSWVRRLYDSYLNRLIPAVGGLVSGQGRAYQYLADSIMDFDEPEELLGLFRQAGLTGTGFQPLTFGVAVMHWGNKPA
jgi:demethylmenaquinone methyltransferase/2-methoxy-6-polyprenyl-1,4-benzoquinol methylase